MHAYMEGSRRSTAGRCTLARPSFHVPVHDWLRGDVELVLLQQFAERALARANVAFMDTSTMVPFFLFKNVYILLWLQRTNCSTASFFFLRACAFVCLLFRAPGTSLSCARHRQRWGNTHLKNAKKWPFLTLPSYVGEAPRWPRFDRAAVVGHHPEEGFGQARPSLLLQTALVEADGPTASKEVGVPAVEEDDQVGKGHQVAADDGRGKTGAQRLLPRLREADKDDPPPREGGQEFRLQDPGPVLGRPWGVPSKFYRACSRQHAHWGVFGRSKAFGSAVGDGSVGAHPPLFLERRYGRRGKRRSRRRFRVTSATGRALPSCSASLVRPSPGWLRGFGEYSRSSPFKYLETPSFSLQATCTWPIGAPMRLARRAEQTFPMFPEGTTSVAPGRRAAAQAWYAACGRSRAREMLFAEMAEGLAARISFAAFWQRSKSPSTASATTPPPCTDTICFSW